MPKLIIKNCQRITELTEFELSGLGFLVGPNNSGKGVVKDALTLLNKLFSGDYQGFREAERQIFREPAQALVEHPFASSNSSEESGDNEIQTNYRSKVFNAPEAQCVGIETEITHAFHSDPSTWYADPEGKFEWDALFHWEDDDVHRKVVGQKILFLYERLPFHKDKLKFLQRFTIQSGDDCILEILIEQNDLQIVLDFKSLEKIGYPPFQGKVIPSKGYRPRIEDKLLISLIPTEELDSTFLSSEHDSYYYFDQDHWIFGCYDGCDTLTTGRLSMPQGLHAFESFFDRFPGEMQRGRGVACLVERLLAYGKIKIGEHCNTYTISGNRQLPSAEDLNTRFRVGDHLKKLVKNQYEFINPYAGPKTYLGRTVGLSSKEDMHGLFGWLILENFVRHTWVRKAALEVANSREFAYYWTTEKEGEKRERIWEFENPSSLLDRVNEDLQRLCGVSTPPSLKAKFRICDLNIMDSEAGHLDLNITEAELSGLIHLETQEGRNLSFEQIGSAIGYVLPVLILMQNQDPRLIGFIEQPELHLHPRMQGDLGELFFENGGKTFPMFIETHSENLILRILRKIRENYRESIRSSIQYPSRLSDVLQGKDVRFYYFQPVDETTTRVHSLNVSPSGHFYEPWPDGFFEERDADLDGLL